MQNEEVCDDHDKDPADLSFVPHNKVESRIEDYCLPSHHTPPTDTNEHSGNMRILPYLEVQHQKAEWMNSTAPGGKQQTPEVKASISLKGHIDVQLKLNGVDPGQSCEGSNHHGGGQVHAIVVGIVRAHGCW